MTHLLLISGYYSLRGDDMIQKDRERYKNFFGTRDAEKECWVHTIFSGLYGECEIRVKVLEGKPVAIEGEPDSDRAARRRLCAEGGTGVIDVYNPSRILYPVKRTNPKKRLYEEPGCKRISWDKAMYTVVEKLKAVHMKDPRSAFFGMTPGLRV
jgi:anaerobic selenocysteine-containing dehydrogenase